VGRDGSKDEEREERGGKRTEWGRSKHDSPPAIHLFAASTSWMMMMYSSVLIESGL
jgi:hypothetical protein